MPADRAAWHAISCGACEPVPRGWLRFCLDSLDIGWLASQQVNPTLAVLEGATVQGHRLVWQAQALSAARRSQRIQGAALRLRDLGLISGWRNEAFACDAAHGERLFELERAAFRFFGLQSRAVHVHGVAVNGDFWCGRRAATKSTDAGLLDNLAAGGLPADEAPRAGAIRELFEEAGVPADIAQGLKPRGQLHTRRVLPDGLHDELLLTFHLPLPADFVPCNQDGEVSEFIRLAPAEALRRCQSGAFTRDAALVMAQAMLGDALTR
jgi:8-oxo-dGTP pyrophosphatase MutT (NUDIX family)